MKLQLRRRKETLMIIFISALGPLSGCQSTSETTEPQACQPEVTQNCEDSEGSDRGYDPCLVNKNLPVCKT